MVAEFARLLESGAAADFDFRAAILEDNLLGKATASGRASVFRNLSSLYGLADAPPLNQALFALARENHDGRTLLALLVALARDPLLRQPAQTVAEATVGQSVHWSDLAAAISATNPGRFSEKMLRSLAQNCASTWTQTGHLQGKVAKTRQRISASAPVVAFAALIATVCGFSGPAILSSAWFKILDLSPDAALDALRAAEARGLARVRAAGDMIEISVSATRGRVRSAFA